MSIETPILQKLLQRLKEEQTNCLALLATPKDKSAFGYGEASGLYNGLCRAERLFEEVVGEAEDET
jgi:hypothetical protein|tara:strand:+ start:724 stop:921 length:198 start_codon:yes stop_codon:yes gene_type:complete